MSTDADADGDGWDHAGFILSSSYRRVTMDRLDDGPATPSQIASDAGERITHISRALQELSDRDLVTLLVDEERKKGRVYGITEDGREAVDKVAESTGGS